MPSRVSAGLVSGESNGIPFLLELVYQWVLHPLGGWSRDTNLPQGGVSLETRGNTVNDQKNAHSQINAPYLIDAPLEVYSLY